MGYFSRLVVDIEELLFEGATVEQISQRLNISIEQVQDYIKQLESSDYDSVSME